MKIALIGATGHVGSAILAEAARRGHSVTAIVRNPGKVSTLPGVKAVTADAADAAALSPLLAGHDVVISAFNGGWGDPDIYNKHLDGSRAIASAADKAGIRLIMVGGAGSLHAPDGSQFVDSPQFPEAWKAGALAARDILTELKAKGGTGWTFVSPAMELSPGERTGTYRLGTETPVWDAENHNRATTGDLADAILNEAEKPQFAGKRFTLGY
ncbi:MAG: NAD(P)H-binding protein [Notoacmeibacter sp.]|nr:NAD(P)H-binding protein [Notoacmeibacter sp.]MCC0032962.1 NAD(P)H-binding protein [Brucellaceae bacterium]